MSRAPITATGHGFPVALVAVGLLLAGAITGCSSSDDSASTTSITATSTSDSTSTTSTTDNTSGETQQLAAVCSAIDLASVEANAAALDEAELVLRAAAGNEGEFAVATSAFLEEGNVFFLSLATVLDPFFAALAQESGLVAIADLTDDFTTAASDFAALATGIESAGAVTPEDLVAIQAVNDRFSSFAEYVNPGSPSGDELRQIPACKTFLKNLDTVTAAISAADGQDELDTAD